VLCAVALLAGDLLRGAHLLTAHHAVCPEHGELVHADAVSGSAHDDAPSGGALASPGSESGHHHDHCGLAGPGSRSQPATTTGPVALAMPSSVTPVVPTFMARCVVARAVVSYAPKQSPPIGA